MAVAIMQPYFFPYLGYFQLVKAVDHFVFYDDVNFIKGGWINRNRILVNKEPKYFGVQMKGASSFKKINEIEIDLNSKNIRKLLNTIQQNYSKAPFFKETLKIVENVLSSDNNLLSGLAGESVKQVSNYLGIKSTFHFSSFLKNNYIDKEREERIISIVLDFKDDEYINASGGIKLYNKEHFKRSGIQLKFIHPTLSKYQKNNSDFVPGLSIIDVLMHSSKEDILIMLDNYSLD